MPKDQPTETLSAVQRFTLHTGPDDMPSKVLDTAAVLLLDTLGVWIAAMPMDAGRIACDAAVRLYGASHPADQAPMPMDGRVVSRAGAAFAAASAIDNLDAHDGYNPTKGHIGVAALPALVALAHGTQISGRDALTDLVVAYEVAGRAGIALHSTVEDYHTSGAWNALGVAALAARRMGLGADPLRHAWGIAEYHGPRSQMMREIANPTMLHDGSGMGALVGISAAVMAEMGFAGAPAITLEAEAVAPYWADLGRFWQVEHQYIKPYPICRWAHAAIDAVWALRRDHGFSADDIEGIDIRSFHNAVQLFPDMPATTSQAQYSMAFSVCCMAAYGEIGVAQISGNGLSDPVVAGLVRRTSVVETPEFEARYPEGRWADVSITLKTGQQLDSGDTHARGGPERPLPQADIEAKFLALATPVLGAARALKIRDAALALSDQNATFNDLTDLLQATA